MELRYVAAFVAVAEELHFGRAARRLQMAQPPLSQMIRQLEKELGVQLFERSTRSVRLTSAGESFLGPARQVLDDVDLAKRAVTSAGTGEYGRVTIGFGGASSHAALPRLARAVRAAHPGIELVMKVQQYANVALDGVADGSLDLGFVRMPVTRAGVRTRVIENDRLVCALPADHPLAGKEEIDLTDLIHDPFVSLPASSGSTLLDAMIRTCEEAGFTPKVVQEAPDSNTVLALVSAGVGVTLTLKSVEHVCQGGLVYLPMAGRTVWQQAALAWRADNPSAALRAVLAIAERELPTPAAES
ncbi:LysR family transcriptional regulator [Actinoplanes italicus]|uniref:DNA-binding transcriptional LysR family regulator n=1 Tax=Actinoplanes italicus TaxID=113567 RepID=A0A2T0JZ75_9ACTN|nr:LysR family transcriptional regulator [Actinoplanes italicus]PRX15793.1 DNA-binding transcriptional LysR family regulator [Actinoplanes italicus]GIE28591.1 LysR family transcriptional regulator [Actinoplanes italicus]